MEPVTSLADFFRKAESDVGYQQALVRSYDNFFGNIPHTYEDTKKLVEDWIRESVGESRAHQDCRIMVDWINLFITDANYKWNPY